MPPGLYYAEQARVKPNVWFLPGVVSTRVSRRHARVHALRVALARGPGRAEAVVPADAGDFLTRWGQLANRRRVVYPPADGLTSRRRLATGPTLEMTKLQPP